MLPACLQRQAPNTITAPRYQILFVREAKRLTRKITVKFANAANYVFDNFVCKYSTGRRKHVHEFCGLCTVISISNQLCVVLCGCGVGVQAGTQTGRGATHYEKEAAHNWHTRNAMQYGIMDVCAS
jgi:hypothetical protein